MSFQYSAIGDNSPENREHLEKLGYDIVNRNDDRTILRTGYPKNNVAISYDDYHLPYLRSYLPAIIDCIGNDPLFRAVTAMRDDSDYMQCFICEVGNSNFWHFCERPSMDEDSRFFGFTAFRKATLDELINHFNSK